MEQSEYSGTGGMTSELEGVPGSAWVYIWTVRDWDLETFNAEG
jgi:hypothetical protein